ncbi:MAG TPA: hypothetical protein VEA80_09290 [Vitreimonas sp.]|uniref:hypothetical protein n=1 Tax=Vitreimonas sp. TaxID=3069702 RepID=UPI002D543FA9|nr:hypothetical protein [Vitreimonas sp.]HYD87656.1 hypothetical protein [Vitreimonas sp.]
MRAFVFAVAAVCMFAGAASAQSQLVSSVTIERGEAATLHFDEGGGAMLIERGVAPPLTPFEESVAHDLSGGAFDYAIGPVSAPMTGDKRPTPSPITPHAVRLKFVPAPDEEHTLLLVENGYEQAFRYRALIYIEGEGEATDVCLVMPALRGFEHWPYRIDRIELSALRLQPWREGDAVPCA